MTNPRRLILSMIAAAFIALLVPTSEASAQYNDPRWGQGRNNSRYGYNNRAVRDAVRRVESRSDDFEDHLDSALDRSRHDRTRREDRINDMASEFHSAARRLKDGFNERDLNRTQAHARQLLQIGARINQFMARNRLASRAEADWNLISSDLRIIANAYNATYYDRNDDYYRGNDRRNRNRDNDRRNPADTGWRWPF